MQTTADENTLISGIKTGDRAAFRQIYEKYVSRMYALALRMAGNTQAAEDLTQEIFIRVWNKIGLFNGKSSFHTWITRVAINVILNQVRSRGTNKELDINKLTRLTANESAYDRETIMDLENAVSRLPPRARLVLILHDIEGYKHNEISRMAGIAEGTSKALLHKARKMVRKELNHELQEI